MAFDRNLYTCVCTCFLFMFIFINCCLSCISCYIIIVEVANPYICIYQNIYMWMNRMFKTTKCWSSLILRPNQVTSEIQPLILSDFGSSLHPPYWDILYLKMCGQKHAHQVAFYVRSCWFSQTYLPWSSRTALLYARL